MKNTKVNWKKVISKLSLGTTVTGSLGAAGYGAYYGINDIVETYSDLAKALTNIDELNKTIVDNKNTYDKEIKKEQNKTQVFKDSLGASNSENAKLRETINEKEQARDKAVSEKAVSNAQYLAKERENKDLKQKIATLESSIASKDETNANKDREIENLKKQIEDLKNNLNRGGASMHIPQGQPKDKKGKPKSTCTSMRGVCP